MPPSVEHARRPSATIDTSSASAGVERRQDAGQARRQHRLARSGRPAHQQVVPPRRGDLQRALGALLALDLARSGPAAVELGSPGSGGGSTASP